MAKILAFDCSSSTVGWCVLEIDDAKNIKFIQTAYIKPPKKGHIIERIAETRKQVLAVINQVQPDYIGIEEIIQFMKGKSTAKTIIMLTTFNRMICLLAYDYLQRAPNLFSVMTIRHGLKLNKTLPAKEDMPTVVSKHLGIKFPYEYKKTGTIKPETYDKADAASVALYYAMKLTDKIKPKKPKKAK